MLEKAEDDDGFNVISQLSNLKEQNKAFQTERVQALKAREDTRAKFVQLLKDKRELNKIHKKDQQ